MSEEKYDFDRLPKWLQELWEENPSIARTAEKYISEIRRKTLIDFLKSPLIKTIEADLPTIDSLINTYLNNNY